MNRAKKNAVKYNGNTLYKPLLVLGKYAPPQHTVKVVCEPGQAIFGRRYEDALLALFTDARGRSEDTSNVEFLPHSSLVFSNLKVDAKTSSAACR